ncbi:MAG: hypothetical protein HW421_3830 [Ignavibacteria bacterium]|nr:hypothetical protein [Ignavibacteria bacterium]
MYVIEKIVIGENNMIFENYQVIMEAGLERFAIVDFSEFQKFRELLSSSEKLQDYLDYLHIQEVKKKKDKMYSLSEAKKELGL